jgi:hypothetical protein
MQPIIEAAWIATATGVTGIVGSVTVALAGFRSMRSATQQTIEADRDRRLWEKRAAAYEAILAAMLSRQAVRVRGKQAIETKKKMTEVLAEFVQFDLPGRYELEGRITAYASRAVRTAYGEVRVADLEVTARYATLKALDTTAAAGGLQVKAQGQGRLPNDQAVIEARFSWDEIWDALLLALEKANGKDRALIELIRAELQDNLSSAGG